MELIDGVRPLVQGDQQGWGWESVIAQWRIVYAAFAQVPVLYHDVSSWIRDYHLWTGTPVQPSTAEPLIQPDPCESSLSTPIQAMYCRSTYSA